MVRSVRWALAGLLVGVVAATAWSAPASASGALVQDGGLFEVTPGTASGSVLPAAVTVGDTVVVAVWLSGGPSAVSLSGTTCSAVEAVSDGESLWSCPDVSGTGSSVTLTGPSEGLVEASEWSGVTVSGASEGGSGTDVAFSGTVPAGGGLVAFGGPGTASDDSMTGFSASSGCSDVSDDFAGSTWDLPAYGGGIAVCTSSGSVAGSWTAENTDPFAMTVAVLTPSESTTTTTAATTTTTAATTTTVAGTTTTGAVLGETDFANLTTSWAEWGGLGFVIGLVLSLAARLGGR